MDTIERLGIVGPSTASGRTLLVHDIDELEKFLTSGINDYRMQVKENMYKHVTQ